MTDEPIRDYDITEAMITYGGGFVAGLGRLYRQADPENQRRLKRSFPMYFEEYAEMVRRRRQTRREAWGDP